MEKHDVSNAAEFELLLNHYKTITFKRIRKLFKEVLSVSATNSVGLEVHLIIRHVPNYPNECILCSTTPRKHLCFGCMYLFVERQCNAPCSAFNFMRSPACSTPEMFWEYFKRHIADMEAILKLYKETV